MKTWREKCKGGARSKRFATGPIGRLRISVVAGGGRVPVGPARAHGDARREDGIWWVPRAVAATSALPAIQPPDSVREPVVGCKRGALEAGPPAIKVARGQYPTGYRRSVRRVVVLRLFLSSLPIRMPTGIDRSVQVRRTWIKRWRTCRTYSVPCLGHNVTPGGRRACASMLFVFGLVSRCDRGSQFAETWPVVV